MNFREIPYYYSAFCAQKKGKVRGGYGYPFCRQDCDSLRAYSDGEYFCIIGRMVTI